MKKLYLLLLSIFPFLVFAQTLQVVTNPTALAVLKGLYNPADYNPPTVSQLPSDIIQGIKNNIDPDSIKSYWTKMGTFFNRSTGNQLASTTKGITATFSWINAKFQEFSTANNNRLVVSDFTFTYAAGICGKIQHKETFAVLPGSDLSDNSVLVFLAHADSRASASCTDAATSAKGMEDNATGVSLVMEVARVMSQFSFKHTIIFMITTGEEQGLYGSNALATYLHNALVNVPVKAVFNNDIVGSVMCLLPTNAVGCSVNKSIDSTTVRIFSGGTINSTSKGWARYIKMQYQENLQNQLAVPANINIMTDIDRVNRSGDHVPFYNLGDAAARMCSFNEPGDGAGSGREHLSADSGGVETKSIKDGTLDSFFVSFTFLKRNAQINATAVAMAAISPLTPTYTITNIGNNKLRVAINTQTNYPAYRLGTRTTTYDFDSVYTFTQLIDTLQMPVSSNLKYYASIAAQDTNAVESLFGTELTIAGTSVILAVGLDQFTASLINDNDVLLQWKVASTDIANTYNVERSDDGTNFNTVGVIQATSAYAYSFHDKNPLNGQSYYRLRMVSNNHYDFSDIAGINISEANQTRIMPSPAHDYFIVKTSVSGKTATLTDMQGRIFSNMIITNGMSVNVANLPAGLYLLKIKDGEVIRFVKN